MRNHKKCTGGGARTPTPLREMDFESTASTNSATPAILNILLKLNYLTYYKNQKQELYIIQNFNSKYISKYLDGFLFLF